MTEFKVAYGENRKAKKWKNGTITLDDRFWPVSAYKKSFLYAGRKFYLHKKFKNYMQKQVDFLHKKS